MNIVVCFSGGHSSAIAAIETVRKYGSKDVVLLNHDISPHVEHEDVKRFKRQVAEYVGLPITYANMPGWEDTPPISIALQLKAFGAPTKFCTNRLKTRPFYAWLERNGSAGDEIIYGFDPNEENRMTRRRISLGSMGYQAVFPLLEWERTIHNTEEIGIDRPVTYEYFRHANCVGCLKAGRQHWYCVFCMRPVIWEEAVRAEAEIGHSIINGVYLSELEMKFSAMKNDLRICPSEKQHPSTFWAAVRKELHRPHRFDQILF